MEDIKTNTTEVITENNPSVEPEVKTYTMEEIKEMMEKNVSQALKTQQKKYEKQLSLSKLDGSEREKAEKDAEIADLKEQLAQFQIERNKSELKSVLSSRGLSAEFADIIAISDDIEAAQANIDALDRLFKQAVKTEVEKRLAGSAPKGNGSGTVELTKESIAKMSIQELQKLKQTNPEAYNRYYN